MKLYRLRIVLPVFVGLLLLGCTKEIPQGLLGQWHWEGYIYTVSSGSYESSAPFKASGVIVFEPNNVVHATSNLCLLFPLGEPTGGTYFLEDSSMVVSCANGGLRADTLYFSISNQKLVIHHPNQSGTAAVYVRKP